MHNILKMQKTHWGMQMLLSLRALVPVVMCLALTGCLTITHKVTVFHNITKPETFSIRPARALAGNLEASAYGDLIAQKLIEKGWSKSDKAAVDVQFDYGLGSGENFGAIGTANYHHWVYTRKLTVWIDEKATKKRIYEATAVNGGVSSHFDPVARCLINALFKDFPGKSGQTSIVNVSAGNCYIDESKT